MNQLDSSSNLLRALILALLVLTAGSSYGDPKMPTEKAVSDMLVALRVPAGYYLWETGVSTQTFDYDSAARKRVGLTGAVKGSCVSGRISFGSWPKGQPRNSLKGYPGMLTLHVAFYSSLEGAETTALIQASGRDRQSLKPYPKGTITGTAISAKSWHFWSPSGPPASLMLLSGRVYVTATFQPDAKPRVDGTGFRKMSESDAKMIENRAVTLLGQSLRLCK